jgi:alpha-methylacyl-CoA racemase
VKPAGPLDDIQVLDFTRLLPGPYCTRLLCELGALIIKVEDTHTGDALRYLPPFRNGISVLFALMNRHKQSVAIDLKTSAGQAIVRKLAAISDVVVEGFRPGVATRIGIDFAALSAVNDRLVYCSISGYGQDGPLRDLAGHDLTYAAASGLIDALSPGEPRVPGVQLVDSAGGLLACVRILAALRAADAGPQYLDVSLVDGARALMPGAFAESLHEPDGRTSVMDLLRGSSRNNLYRCADGRWLAVSPLEEPFWWRLCITLRENGALAADETPTAESLHSIFRKRSCHDWYVLLGGAGVPCAPVNQLREAMEDPERLGLSPCNDGAAIRREGIDPRAIRAPALGEHTAAWITALGYSAHEIATLQDQSVILLGAAGDRSEG